MLMVQNACAFHKLQLQLVQRSKGQVESLAKRKYVTQIPGAELPVQVKLLCTVQNDSYKGSKVQIVSFRSSFCAVVKKVDHRARQKGNIYGVSFVNIKSSLRIGCVSGAKISLRLASSTTATTEQGGPPTTNTGPKHNDLICFGNTILVVDNTSLLPWRL